MDKNAPLINTPLQRGDVDTDRGENCFSGLPVRPRPLKRFFISYRPYHPTEVECY